MKFDCEKYFKNEISSDELENTAAKIRSYGWKKQSAAGIDFIPCNDFSFYDNVLDAAFLFGAVPKRYSELNLSELDKYFAVAHGYQGEKGDVKALPMKKWFNTNYHYIVPELSDETKIALNEKNKVLAEFNESKSLGIETVPGIIGAYTFLHLASFKGKKHAEDFAEDFADSYAELARKLSEAGAKWISFSEPALVLDMGESEKSLFSSIYKRLISKIRSTSNIKIAISTFFGDIRDVYDDVVSLELDGIGLDFIEGKQSLSLLENGFPKNTVLFAGIVNGKNIWKSS